MSEEMMLRADDYVTRHELEFLDGLGTHSCRGPAVGRLALLQRYQVSLSYRASWSGLQRAVIEAHVQQLLAAARQENALFST